MKFLPSTPGARIRLCALLLFLAAASYALRDKVNFYRALVYFALYSPREGDIVFQSLPHEDLADAIEGVTHSPFSHCGVVLRQEGRWIVYESIIDVHGTPLLQWILRGRNWGFAAYRLDGKYQAVLPEFKRQLLAYNGFPYDYDYEISDKAIYCSELPYKAFLKTTGEELGKLEKLGDLDWKPYERFIRTFQRNKLPLERVMITPASLAQSRQLKPVFRKGI